MAEGKKYKSAAAKVDRSKRYLLDDACKLLPDTKVAKFDESVDIAVRLGVDPKHADQMVRGAVVLPHGTGKGQRGARRGRRLRGCRGPGGTDSEGELDGL